MSCLFSVIVSIFSSLTLLLHTKKVFKVIAAIFISLVFLGWLLPDTKKDKASGSALASTGETTAEAAPAEAEKPELEILKSNETVTKYMRKIHVKVRNNTDHLISYADLKGVYYNKKGDVVGTGMGNAANIASGATKTIDIMSMGVEGASRYEVEVGNVLGKCSTPAIVRHKKATHPGGFFMPYYS